MENLSQNDTPIKNALLNYNKNRIVRFDVPGHKGGRKNEELVDFFGKKCIELDVNSMKPLDNICHPTGIIKSAQILFSQAFNSKSAFLMVGGTTSSVQAMIMSVVKEGDKIILPRNVHKSAINALIISGASPVYINPEINSQYGIPLGVSTEKLKNAIDQNKDAKAVFINNPTYFGVCSDIEEIIKICHKNNILVLIDEAHGTHFYFGENMPKSAMECGADMSAVSMHKTGGSLTQSSVLLCNINENHTRQVINLMQTTSASYLFLASLDIARKNLVLNGKDIFKKTLEIANYSRNEINLIGGFIAFGEEFKAKEGAYDFDFTKLSINTSKLGLAGIEVYDILRDDFGIQVEFGDTRNILAIISHADRMLEIERLIGALSEIKRLYRKEEKEIFSFEYIASRALLTPKEAFYSEKRFCEINLCKGLISAESVMCYPPGIPILAPGEVVTEEIIEYINYVKDKGCLVTGAEDLSVRNLKVVV